ncbi:hypothetical protein [Aliterella atlantica]|uniref:CopG family transcriptional regulator n=1 Tax=Aliterella atlantica CENA595 TaxID=1618023 RepID=A0A0D8ZPP4_9CYAN|nr:hypothetical protein [Aliterella atlantica]KJH70317.1 hypothetical protein UH38_18580 [Aliterella atlantica CENA595]
MEERESLTVRLPVRLLTQVKLYKAQNESLNDLAIAAPEREVSHRKGLAAYQRIIDRREKIKQKTDTQLSSVNLIRQLRADDL